MLFFASRAIISARCDIFVTRSPRAPLFDAMARLTPRMIPPERRGQSISVRLSEQAGQIRRGTSMKSFLIFAALLFSVSAFAQGAPKVGTKPLVQVKPKGHVGCKLLGLVNGTKVWAGDCIANEPTDPMGPLPTEPAEEKK